MYKKIFLIALIVFFSNFSIAETAKTTGKVGPVYIYNNGMVLFTGFVFDSTKCQNNGGFFVSGDHPHADRYISIMLAAKAMKSDVSVTAKIDDCWYPEVTGKGQETTYIVVH